MRLIITWGYSMWNTLKTTAKENIKDFFKVNGAAAGSVGASELGWLDWMGMPELIQSWVVTGTVIIIFLYNAGKAEIGRASCRERGAVQGGGGGAGGGADRRGRGHG